MSIDFFFSSRRRHTRWTGDWSSDVCSSDLAAIHAVALLDGGLSDGLSQVTFAATAWAEKQSVFPLGDERSEERRVGKECRSRWWRYDEKKNKCIHLLHAIKSRRAL